jgi:hypothetical protein
MLPNAGAKNGIQYLKITASGFRLLMYRAAFIQDKGWTVLINLVILNKNVFSPEFSYCVVPGNNKEGYCSVKDTISASIPWCIRAEHKLSLNLAGPPLYGKAGPTMIIFFMQSKFTQIHNCNGSLHKNTLKFFVNNIGVRVV